MRKPSVAADQDQRDHLHIAASLDDGQHSDDRQDDDADAAAQAVQSVDQIDGVGDARDPEERHDEGDDAHVDRDAQREAG